MLFLAGQVVDASGKNRLVSLGDKNQFRGPGAKIKFEASRRSQILREVQLSRLFLEVCKVSIPIRLGLVAALAARRAPEDSRIRIPGDAVSGDLRREIQQSVLVMSGMKVAARQKQSHQK